MMQTEDSMEYETSEQMDKHKTHTDIDHQI